jgi:hypothetical protein
MPSLDAGSLVEALSKPRERFSRVWRLSYMNDNPKSNSTLNPNSLLTGKFGKISQIYKQQQ